MFQITLVIAMHIYVVPHQFTHTPRDATPYNMHSDQADLHDAVHKLEKFRSHSSHIDY